MAFSPVLLCTYVVGGYVDTSDIIHIYVVGRQSAVANFLRWDPTYGTYVI